MARLLHEVTVNLKNIHYTHKAIGTCKSQTTEYRVGEISHMSNSMELGTDIKLHLLRTVTPTSQQKNNASVTWNPGLRNQHQQTAFYQSDRKGFTIHDKMGRNSNNVKF